MLDREALVGKLVAIDGLPAGAVPAGEVTTLAHELRDDAVEGGPLVAKSFFARREGLEVGRRLGHHFAEETKDHATGGLPSNGEVEVYLGGRWEGSKTGGRWEGG